MKLFSMIALGLLVCAGCTAGRITGKLALDTLSVVHVYVQPIGAEGATPTVAALEAGANTHYLAVDAMVDVRIWIEAPITSGGASVPIWEEKLEAGTGQRAWRIVVSIDQEQEFLQVVPCSWDEARAELIRLSPTKEAGRVRTLTASRPSIPVRVYFPKD